MPRALFRWRLSRRKPRPVRIWTHYRVRQGVPAIARLLPGSVLRADTHRPIRTALPESAGLARARFAWHLRPGRIVVGNNKTSSGSENPKARRDLFPKISPPTLAPLRTHPERCAEGH